MTKQDILDFLSANKGRFSRTYGVRTLGLFGSYSRDEASPSSDIDILVEFDRPVGYEIVDLTIDLEHHFNLKVDVVSRKALNPALQGVIEQEVIYV